MSKTILALSIGAALAGRSADVVMMDDLDEALIGDRSKPIGGLLPEKAAPTPKDDGVMTRQRRRALERARQKARRT